LNCPQLKKQFYKDSNPQRSDNLTPQQLANINSRAFDPNVNLGISPLTTDRIPFPPSQVFGNTIDRRVGAGLPYVGRNRGPTARFADI
jgi:hypothetical protein